MAGSFKAGVLGVLVLPGMASLPAMAMDVGVFPPGGTYYGKSMGEWTAEWWKWAVSIPAPGNPILGGPCGVGQSGPVFFLPGGTGGMQERTCTVPCGKAVLVALLNGIFWSEREGQPGDCRKEEPEVCRASAQAALGQASDLSLEIDGKLVANIGEHREESPFFSFTAPEDNFLGILPGEYEVGISDGFWCLLTPLPPGRHTIRARGAIKSVGLEVDVTTHVTVEGCPEPRLHEPGSMPHGKSVGDWTAEFWRWAMSLPAPSHPISDPDGSRCGVGQPPEPVFYLGSPPGVLFRSCRMPCGKSILMPTYAYLTWGEEEGRPGDCPKSQPEQCLAAAQRNVEGVSLVECEVDGVPVSDLIERKVEGPFFDFVAVQDNIFGSGAGRYEVAVSVGFWVMLEPLAPGWHTFRGRSKVGEPPFEGLLTEILEVGPCGFRRGDADANGAVNITDAVSTLDHLFRGGGPLPCGDAADSDDSGVIDLTDAVFTLEHLFRGGPVPPAPGPTDCGDDETPDDPLDCVAGC